MLLLWLSIFLPSAFSQNLEPWTQYLGNGDTSFAWEVWDQRDLKSVGLTVTELRVQSQTWQKTLWKHQVLLFDSPKTQKGKGALVILVSEKWDSALDKHETDHSLSDLESALETKDGIRGTVAGFIKNKAKSFNLPIIVVRNIMMQPMYDRTEDELIAFTYEQALAEKDPVARNQWPMLVPMTKAVMRILDATDAYYQKTNGVPIGGYFLAGGSKTAWAALSVAVHDPRAVGVFSLAFGLISIPEQLAYEREIWGAISSQYGHYQNVLGFDAEKLQNLAEIIDMGPWMSKLKQPYFSVLSTGDGLWPVDSAKLYWDKIGGPKYLMLSPNVEHTQIFNSPQGVQEGFSILGSMLTVSKLTLESKSLPKPGFKIASEGVLLNGTVEIFEGDSVPATATLWVAVSENRDFRKSKFEAVRMRRDGQKFAGEFEKPTTGFVASFIRLDYNLKEGALGLSSQVVVEPAKP